MEMEATGAPQKHHHTLNQQVGSITGAVNRGYARWGKWLWGSLLLPVVIYLGWSVWAAVWGPPSGPVTLIIHNELDRPVLGFSVNGVAGANAFAHGGGGNLLWQHQWG